VVFKGAWRTKTRRRLGDDVPEGKLTSFPMAVQRRDDETVVFSWIIWPSREVRDDISSPPCLLRLVLDGKSPWEHSRAGVGHPTALDFLSGACEPMVEQKEN
jgi:hypothetical protein